MTKLTRFDPFNLSDSMDDVFEGFFRPVLGKGLNTPQIKLDVQEDDVQYKVKAEIPGVKKEDIHIDIDGNIVSISAEIQRDEEEKEDTKVIRSERYFGKALRSFSLDRDVDEAKADATYKDGVLALVLPKKEGNHSKRLEVR